MTITRHVINGVVCLYLGGLMPSTNVIQWQPVTHAWSSSENIDETGHRLSPDSAYVEASFPRLDQPLYEARECVAILDQSICEPTWHLETGPLECFQDIPEGGCDPTIWHKAASTTSFAVDMR